MATRERVRSWLGTHANTPSGHAWGAVLLADYDELTKTLERYGKQATEAVHGALGNPVTALTAGAVRGDTRAVTMLLDAGAAPEGTQEGLANQERGAEARARHGTLNHDRGG